MEKQTDSNPETVSCPTHPEETGLRKKEDLKCPLKIMKELQNQARRTFKCGIHSKEELVFFSKGHKIFICGDCIPDYSYEPNDLDFCSDDEIKQHARVLLSHLKDLDLNVDEPVHKLDEIQRNERSFNSKEIQSAFLQAFNLLTKCFNKEKEVGEIIRKFLPCHIDS